MKKLVTTLLVVALTLCALNFSFMSTSAETVQGDSPNLITMNHSFTEGILPFAGRGKCKTQVYTQDSQDADGYSCLVYNRENYDFSALGLNAGDIIREQGAGKYTFSFWARTLNSGESLKLKAAAQIEYLGDTTNQYRKHYSSRIYTIDNNWTQIVLTFNAITEDRPTVGNAFMYIIQADLNEEKTNMYDILTDNWSIIKNDSHVYVPPVSDIDPLYPVGISQQERSEQTQISAIYYNPWTGTSDEWRENGEIKVTNDQTARSLSPSQFHYMAPFYADVDPETNRVIFPKQTVATWKEEMQYAINAGITHINYLWEGAINATSYPIKWQQNADINSQIGMCGILSDIANTPKEGFNMLFEAMKGDYWLKYNNMPVVYILNGVSLGTTDVLHYIRKKAAMSGITEPLYIIGMGYENQNTAIAAANNGVNAASFYAAGARATAEEYSDLCAYSAMLHNRLLPAKNVMSIAPMATMGRNNQPRIINPVSWAGGTNPYGGYYTKDGTPEQLGQQLLDVLNWNKQNADACRPNMVTIYAWNEHDEGGWLCPTLVCDENGNVQRDENGNALRNTSHIDAIKQAIDIYREHEQYATRMVSYDGTVTDTLSIKKNDIKTATGRFSNLDDWTVNGNSAKYVGKESSYSNITLTSKATIAQTESGDASHGNVIKLTQAGNQSFQFVLQNGQASDKMAAGVWKIQYSVFVPLDALVSGVNQFWIAAPINYDPNSGFNDISDLAVEHFNYLNYTICRWNGCNWLQSGDKTITKGVWKTYTTYAFVYDIDGLYMRLSTNNSYPVGTEIDDLSAEYVCSFDDVNAAIQSGDLVVTEVTGDDITKIETNEPKKTNVTNLINYVNNIRGTDPKDIIRGVNDIKTPTRRFSNLDDWTVNGNSAKYVGKESSYSNITLTSKTTIAQTESGDASHGNVIKLTQAGNQSFQFVLQNGQASDKMAAGIWKIQYSVFVPLDALVSGVNQFWIAAPINYDPNSGFNDISDLAVEQFNYLNYTLCRWNGCNWLQSGDKTITKGVWKTYTTYAFVYDIDGLYMRLSTNNSYPVGTEIDDLSAEYVCSFDDVNAAIQSGDLVVTEVTGDDILKIENQEPKKTNVKNLINYISANFTSPAQETPEGVVTSIMVDNVSDARIDHYRIVTLTAVAGENIAFDGWYYDGKLVSSSESYTVYTDPSILAKLEARFKRFSS